MLKTTLTTEVTEKIKFPLPFGERVLHMNVLMSREIATHRDVGR